MRARFFSVSGDKYETTKKIKVMVHNRDNEGADPRESITEAKRARLVKVNNATSVGDFEAICKQLLKQEMEEMKSWIKEEMKSCIKEEMKKEWHCCKRQHSVMNHNDLQTVSEVRKLSNDQTFTSRG